MKLIFFEGTEDERSMSNSMVEEMNEDEVTEKLRQSKRMRNSVHNQEPSMNSHNIHVLPPNTTATDTSTNMNTSGGMVNNNSENMHSEPTNGHEGTVQVTT